MDVRKARAENYKNYKITRHFLTKMLDCILMQMRNLDVNRVAIKRAFSLKKLLSE